MDAHSPARFSLRRGFRTAWQTLAEPLQRLSAQATALATWWADSWHALAACWNRPHRAGGPRRSASRPVLEALEDRCVPTTAAFSTATASVNENGGSVALTVNLDSSSSQPITVYYGTS